MAKSTGLVGAGRFSPRDFRDAKRAWSQRLLAGGAVVVRAAARRTGAHATAGTRPVPARRNPNVVGVGIAEKLVDGKATGIMAVKFFVKTKHPASAVARALLASASRDGSSGERGAV